MVEDDSKFEQISHRNEQQNLEFQEAKQFINSNFTGMSPTGGYDSEPSTLRRLLEELESKDRKRSIMEIRKEAADIIARRNLDH